MGQRQDIKVYRPRPQILAYSRLALAGFGSDGVPFAYIHSDFADSVILPGKTRDKPIPGEKWRQI